MAERPQTLSGDTGLVLPEFDNPPEGPHDLMLEWFDSAMSHGVREPFAAVLATCDSSGRPSSRVLLVKEVDARGLLFTSFRGSRKGRDLATSPWASLTFYWRETLQQLTVEGVVESLPTEEADTLFAQRPLAAQATTAVSRQSRPLEDEVGLRNRAKELIESGGPVSRPDDWGGYRLVPRGVEFWYGSPDRLHRRLRYDRSNEAAQWSAQRLQP